MSWKGNTVLVLLGVIGMAWVGVELFRDQGAKGIRIEAAAGDDKSASADLGFLHSESGILDTEALEQLEASQPLGQLAERAVLGSRFKVLEEGRFERRLLLAGSGAVLRSIVQVETYSPSDDDSGFSSSLLAYKADAFLVDADPANVDPAAFEAFLEEEGLEIESRSRLSDYVVVRAFDVSMDSIDRLVDAARKQFPNTIVDRDVLHFSSAASDDYSGAFLWHLNQIGAEDAWEFQTGSGEVVIGIVDTGIARTHPDLVDNIFINTGEIAGNGIDDDRNGFVDDVSGWDFSDDDANPNDVRGHGTHVAGLAGARGNNGEGLVGVNWNVKLMPLKVGENDGLSTSAINEALRYARSFKSRGINVVATNNSYGSTGSVGSARREIENQEDAGILFVAAAGNEGEDFESGDASYPAAYDMDIVISVANSTQSDQLSRGSNYGSAGVDLAAPGTDVFSTYLNNGYDALTGTSMSSPIVAGAVALLKSEEPALSWREVKQRIMDTVDPVDALEGLMVTGGRLNVGSMLRPELKGHTLSIPNLEGRIVHLREGVRDLEFSVEALDGAAVAARFLGDSDGATVSNQGRNYQMNFAAEGVYSFEALATLAGVERRVVRDVYVGDAGLDVASGIVHEWDFEGSGNAVEDRAGSGAGTLSSATRVQTPLGRGVRFDGQNSRMAFSASSPSRVTISAYVNLADFDASPHPRIVNTPDYYLYISSFGGVGSPEGNTNTLKFFANRSANDFGVWNAPPQSVVENRWMHVLATYDSSNNTNAPRLFIDGNEQKVRLQSLPVGSQTSGGGASYLGDNEEGTRDFDGDMDNVRVYNRELAESEVSALAMQYIGKRWAGNDIRNLDTIEFGRPIRFAVGNVSGNLGDVKVVWKVSGEASEYLIEEGSDGVASITFFERRRFVVGATVGDASGTEVFAREVEVETENADPYGDWLTVNFGPDRPEPAGQWERGGDYDSDGSSNLFEFLHDLDPSDPGSKFSYAYRLRADGFFEYLAEPLAEGFEYELEGSADYELWLPLKNAVSSLEGSQLKITFPQSESRRFMRLRVSEIPDVSSE